jgi:hypothetical protein
LGEGSSNRSRRAISSRVACLGCASGACFDCALRAPLSMTVQYVTLSGAPQARSRRARVLRLRSSRSAQHDMGACFDCAPAALRSA